MPDRTWQHVSAAGDSTTASAPSKTSILLAPPKTDIWRPSPDQDDFNVARTFTTIPFATFSRAAVTVSGPWKTQYDQGGLLLTWPSTTGGPVNWVKAGIEFVDGNPAVSVVGCLRFSDWSLCPLPEGETKARVQAEKVGTTLWVYWLREKGRKQPLREIKWAFPPGTQEVSVGICVAKPTPEKDDESKGIEVTFEDFELQTE